MRSELVYSAGIKIANRFLLATVAIKAVRKLHISTTRTEDTANVVFVDVAAGRYEPIAEVPGFTRGLDFFGELAFVGLSQVRESAVFSGLR